MTTMGTIIKALGEIKEGGLYCLRGSDARVTRTIYALVAGNQPWGVGLEGEIRNREVFAGRGSMVQLLGWTRYASPRSTPDDPRPLNFLSPVQGDNMPYLWAFTGDGARIIGVHRTIHLVE